VVALTALIDNAKREAGLSKQMLADMQRLIDELGTAEDHAQQYLQKINDALVKGFSDFGTQLSNQVANTIKQTDTHLSKGVGHLTGVVQELGVALARMPRRQ
jgi:hypothetical protein